MRKNSTHSATDMIDRRLRRRYPIALNLEYRMLSGSQVLRVGSGATVNLSSGGVLFQCQHPLPPQAYVELRIDWPFLLNGVLRLQLKVQGCVVRSDGQGTAIHTWGYEFRLCSTRIARATSDPLRDDK
jgi:PilZ domain